jgi:hypothetical protein
MPWLKEQGKRKWISGKKWKRHQHRGMDTELYARVKEDEHRRWKEKKGIRSKGNRLNRLFKRYPKYADSVGEDHE